jgi:hypothetical protein
MVSAESDLVRCYGDRRVLHANIGLKGLRRYVTIWLRSPNQGRGGHALRRVLEIGGRDAVGYKDGGHVLATSNSEMSCISYCRGIRRVMKILEG